MKTRLKIASEAVMKSLNCNQQIEAGMPTHLCPISWRREAFKVLHELQERSERRLNVFWKDEAS